MLHLIKPKNSWGEQLSEASPVKISGCWVRILQYLFVHGQSWLNRSSRSHSQPCKGKQHWCIIQRMLARVLGACQTWGFQWRTSSLGVRSVLALTSLSISSLPGIQASWNVQFCECYPPEGLSYSCRSPDSLCRVDNTKDNHATNTPRIHRWSFSLDHNRQHNYFLCVVHPHSPFCWWIHDCHFRAMAEYFRVGW